MTAEIVLPYPVSANRYWRMRINPKTNHPFMSVSNEGRQYKKLVRQLLTLKRLNKPHPGSIFIELVLHPRKNIDGTASKVCIDLDNALKVTLDSLQGLVFKDDNQITKIIAEIGKPKPDGGISLLVHKLRD